jgi:hypothetical protein
LLLAYRRNKPETACQWKVKPVRIKFNRDKRGLGRLTDDGRGMILDPIPGERSDRSRVYTAAGRQEWLRDQDEINEMAQLREWSEGGPAVIDFSPPNT